MKDIDMIEFFKRYQREYPATARLEYYLNAAQQYRREIKKAEVRVRVDDEGTHKSYKADPITLLETYVGIAQQALSDGDIDHFAQAFEQVIRYTVKLNLPEHDKEMARIKQSNAGKGNKGKIRFFRPMLEEICKKIDSTKNEGVLNYWHRFDNRDAAEEEPRPYVWAVWNGTKYDYWYADDNDHVFPATIDQIRTALNRLRKRDSASK